MEVFALYLVIGKPMYKIMVFMFLVANSSNSTILPTPTITKEFVEAASSKLVTSM